MICKKCNAVIEDDSKFCPVCGADLTEPEQNEAVVAEQTVEAVEETVAETLEAAAEVQEDTAAEELAEESGEEPSFAEGPEASQKPKTHTALWIILGVVAAAIIALLALMLTSKPAETNDKLELSGMVNYTLPAEEFDDTVATTPVASVAEKSFLTDIKEKLGMGGVSENGLTNSELALYYWMNFYNFCEQNYMYLSYMGMDPAALETSQYSDNTSWQEYFLQNALENYRHYAAISMQAEKEGYQLSEEEQKTLDETISQVRDDEAFDTEMQSTFGPGVTAEMFTDLIYKTATYSSYVDSLEKNITVTDRDAEDYFNAHEQEFAAQGIEKIDKNVVNVRHILISVDTEAGEDAWTQGEKTANEIYNTWLSGDKTEESFAELAAQYSADGGSAGNGGLYENVYPGQMVPEFNDWCFDDARKPGDTGIVKTDYGYHIMYYVGQGDYVYWRKAAADACKSAKLAEAIENIVSNYKLDVDLDKVKISAPSSAVAGS